MNSLEVSISVELELHSNTTWEGHGLICDHSRLPVTNEKYHPSMYNKVVFFQSTMNSQIQANMGGFCISKNDNTNSSALDWVLCNIRNRGFKSHLPLDMDNQPHMTPLTTVEPNLQWSWIALNSCHWGYTWWLFVSNAKCVIGPHFLVPSLQRSCLASRCHCFLVQQNIWFLL